jgi:hypothetical protein
MVFHKENKIGCEAVMRDYTPLIYLGMIYMGYFLFAVFMFRKKK